MKDETSFAPVRTLNAEEVTLGYANHIMRTKHFESAAKLYLQLLKKKPELKKIIGRNLELIRYMSALDRKKFSGSRTLICGQPAMLGRILTLASVYQELNDVNLFSWELADNLAPKTTLGSIYLPLTKKVFFDDSRAIDQVVEWVAAHPQDVVHLVGLNGINFFLGIFYKLIWSANVVFDISGSVQEIQRLPVSDFSSSTFGEWTSKYWESNAYLLAQLVDNISVSTPAIQALTAGEIIRDLPHSTDEHNRTELRKKYFIRQTAQVILLANLDVANKEALVSLEKILNLQRSNLVFVILGKSEHQQENFSFTLDNDDGIRFLYLDDAESAEALTIANAALFLNASTPNDWVVPSRLLLEAIIKSIPVFAYPVSDFFEFFECQFITPVDSYSLENVFDRFFSNPEEFVERAWRAQTEFSKRFTFDKNVEKLRNLHSEKNTDPHALETLIRKLHEAMPSETELANTICNMTVLRAPEQHSEKQVLLRFKQMLTGLILQHGYEDEFANSTASLLSESSAELFLAHVFEIFFNRELAQHESLHFLPKLVTIIGRLEVLLLLLQCPEAKEMRKSRSGALQFVISDKYNAPEETSSNFNLQIESNILFPKVDKPVVSIIIPVYGKIEFTLAALRSIQSNLPKVTFEVIVIDDYSPDSSLSVLRQLETVTVIENQENLGFIRSCNRGASHAKGEYLCFLNNDTEVNENWLDALIQTFVDFPMAGMAGSKLIYPDGRLQEAGGILWRDASAWNFGKFQDPQLPEFNYARDVDFCSGASIVISRAIFEQLGGFDEHYLPAYYEDVDLALKVRNLGLQVIYQPCSKVIHHEGITSGTDVASGVKSSQISNQKKLFGRWSDLLDSHHENGIHVDKAKDRFSPYRALVLDHCTPTPDRDAGSILTFNILILLREMGFQVTFVPEDNYLYMPEYTPALQQRGIEVLYAPYVNDISQHLSEQGARYDLVFVFRPGAAEKHFPAIRQHCSRAKVIFHTVDLHYLRMMRQAACDNDTALFHQADIMKSRELSAIKAADTTIVVSTWELAIVKQEIPDASAFVFPLVLNVRGSTINYENRKDIVFVGGFQHQPNVDAVEYFVRDIMPLLRKKSPKVNFVIIGSNVPDHIHAMACDDVIIKGFVQNLQAALDECRVAAAPLRYGAGVKGKIASAMCAGVPTVATSIATEGMSIQTEHDILTADTPQDFANAIMRLYVDKNLWSQIQKNALNRAEQLWGAKAAWGHLQVILESQGFEIAPCKRNLSLY